jgi:hypothetical protein
MSIYPMDHRFWIMVFQETLTDSALAWYFTKKLDSYTTFKELATDFLSYYSFNIEMAPTISDLRKLIRQPREPIKSFAQRFRQIAAQIKPSLTDRELVLEFRGILPKEFTP